MPRPRLNVPAPQLSAGQASYVLDCLIADRRISASEVSRYVSDMHREINDLESRLQTLRAHAGASAPAAAAPAAATGGTTTTGKRRGRPPGRPPGSGKRRGRPPGSGKKAVEAAPASPMAASPAVAAGPAKRRRRL